MAEYDMEIEQQPGMGTVGEADDELFAENDYGASEEQGDLMEIDDVPVSQEDAWAVIS